MKLLLALFFGLSSAALAQNTTDQRSTTFNFNQANLAINLDQKDFETIYRTDQVPDTCYRDEVQGTRTECHTEYDRQCNTRYEQECYNRSYPVCQTIPRRVSSEQCTTQMDQVCNSHGCTSIPRRVCNPVEQCSTEMDQVCHTEQRQECQSVPREYCQDIPRQECSQVPNVVKIPYACTRPVQVPVGQKLKLDTSAQVILTLVNFAEVGVIPDTLVAELNNGVVKLSVKNEKTSAFLYQIIGQKRDEQIVGNTQKTVTYTISIMATSVQKLNAFLNSEISGGKLFFDRLEFSASGLTTVPLKGHLKIVQYRFLRSGLIMIDDDFAPAAVVGQNGVQSIAFNNFGVTTLNTAKHSVELSLDLDRAKLQNGLINPGALAQVTNKPVLNSFEATPQ